MKTTTLVAAFALFSIANSSDSLEGLDSEGTLLYNATDPCDQFTKIPWNQRCKYARMVEDCSGESFNYLEAYACIDTDLRVLVIIAYIVELGLLFYLLATTADKYFCPQLEELSDRMGLTPRVAGVTLLSLGNGAPDIFSGISAIAEGETGLVLGQLTGGGMFVASIVAGSVLKAAGGIRTRFPLLRDIMLYLVACIGLCLLVAFDQLNAYSAGAMLAYYVLFVGLAYWSDKRLVNRFNSEQGEPGDVPMLERNTSHIELMNKEYRLTRHARSSGMDLMMNQLSYSEEGKEKRSFVGFTVRKLRSFVRWVETPFDFARDMTVLNCVKESWSAEADSRLHGAFAVAGTPLLFGFWRDVLADDLNGLPIWALLLLVGVPAGFLFLAMCPTDYPPQGKISIFCIALGFVSSALWVNVFADQLVDLLTALGRIFAISDVIMGATVLAWGNCVGDLTADVLLAKNKREGMAITACFAGPMFNLLLVMGIGVLLKSIQTGKEVHVTLTTQTLLSFSFLFASVAMSVVVAFGFGKLGMQGGNRLPERFAYFLWAIYACYLVSMIVYEAVARP